MIVATDQRPAAAFSESLKVAIEKLKQGDAQGALRAASDACHARPRSRSAHYIYGECWLA